MWRPDLEDYLAIASVVLELDYDALRRLPGLPLAESALAAPFGGFGEEEAYPSLEQKAAVLLERLVGNHALPDGNKRSAFLLLLLFLERNGRPWGEPDVTEDGETVRRIAAGEISREDAENWISFHARAAGTLGRMKILVHAWDWVVGWVMIAGSLVTAVVFLGACEPVISLAWKPLRNPGLLP